MSSLTKSVWKEIHKVASPAAEDAISDLHLSPTSSIISASSYDGTIRLWQYNKTSLQQVHPSHSYTHGEENGTKVPVTRLRFSPSGRYLASAGANFVGHASIKLVDLQSSASQKAEVSQELSGHKNIISSLRWVDLNENNLVSASLDHTVRLWDLRLHNQCNTLTLPNKVLGMDIVPGGTTIFAAAADHIVYEIDLRKNAMSGAYILPEKPNWNVDLKKVMIQSGKPSRVLAFQYDPDVLRKKDLAIPRMQARPGFMITYEYHRAKVNLLGSTTYNVGNKADYTFKAHTGDSGSQVWPITTASRHPKPGLVMTSGNDTMILWDLIGKKALRRYRLPKEAGATSCTAVDFNREGDICAFAMGYDYSFGAEHRSAGTSLYLAAFEDFDRL